MFWIENSLWPYFCYFCRWGGDESRAHWSRQGKHSTGAIFLTSRLYVGYSGSQQCRCGKGVTDFLLQILKPKLIHENFLKINATLLPALPVRLDCCLTFLQMNQSINQCLSPTAQRVVHIIKRELCRGRWEHVQIRLLTELSQMVSARPQTAPLYIILLVAVLISRSPDVTLHL